jgi:hypothetical protein
LSRTGFREAIRVVAYPPFLKKTIRTALIVGLVLFFINHFDEVLHGYADAATWIKRATTCSVPFCVANWGILIATRAGALPARCATLRTRKSRSWLAGLHLVSAVLDDCCRPLNRDAKGSATLRTLALNPHIANRPLEED